MTPYVFRRWPRLLLLAPLLLCCSACLGGNNVPVKGKVMNGDDPLKTGTVTFYPDKDKGNTSAALPQAQISEDGTYTLYTDGNSGAPPGWYKVTVVAEAPKAKGADEYAPPVYIVAEDYTNMEYTPLSVEVKSGAPEGHYDLKLLPRR